MRIADQWQDFEILDTSSGEKLERWGNTILIRPDPQVIWRPEKGPEWQKADARYNRSSAGGGSWQIYRSHPQFWTIGYRDLKFKISPTGFKHTGLFPEQAVSLMPLPLMRPVESTWGPAHRSTNSPCL